LEIYDGYAIALLEERGISIFATVETMTTHVPALLTAKKKRKNVGTIDDKSVPTRPGRIFINIIYCLEFWYL
jgi:hypothetical protein